MELTLENIKQRTEWASDDDEADCLDFFAKVQLQRDILQIMSGKIKRKDVQWLCCLSL